MGRFIKTEDFSCFSFLLTCGKGKQQGEEGVERGGNFGGNDVRVCQRMWKYRAVCV